MAGRRWSNDLSRATYSSHVQQSPLETVRTIPRMDRAAASIIRRPNSTREFSSLASTVIWLSETSAISQSKGVRNTHNCPGKYYSCVTRISSCDCRGICMPRPVLNWEKVGSFATRKGRSVPSELAFRLEHLSRKLNQSEYEQSIEHTSLIDHRIRDNLNERARFMHQHDKKSDF
jgi:hypothetical protein